jgi:teichuronic acid biosynthesis glycosyltransferase TuaG
MEKVSVITPNYNGSLFLERVVKSVDIQFYNLEHIIVDDCSTDDSWAKINLLANRYPFISPHRLDINSGPVAARNYAISNASGRYLAFLDVDDYWLESKLRTQIEFMISNNVGLSFTDYRFISIDSTMVGRRISGFNKIGWHAHHMTRYLGCSTVIIDRRFFDDFSFPDTYPASRAEDFIAWSRFIKKGGLALRCPHDLTRYTVGHESRSYSRKGAISVWRIYRIIEKIPFITASFYFVIYALFVLHKRWWFRPLYANCSIDH